MVVTKAEILGLESETVSALIASNTTSIDSMLHRKGSGVISLMDISSRWRPVVAQELIRLYTKAGWTVKENKGSDQRDGDWHQLIFD
jgi:hypothetical protein